MVRFHTCLLNSLKVILIEEVMCTHLVLFSFRWLQKVNCHSFGKVSEEFARLHSSKGIPFMFSQLKYIIKKCLEKNPDMRYIKF